MWWYGDCVKTVCDWVVANVVLGAPGVITMTAPKCFVEELDAPVDPPAKKNKRTYEYSHFVCGAQRGR